MRTNESVRDDHTTSESLLNRRQPDRIALGLTVDAYHNASCEHVLHECDRCLLTDQRVFYLHRTARRSYWYPPYVAWHCTLGLPYGYELAIDEFGTQYYIHHIHQTTSYKDPRCSSSLEAIENATTSTFQNDNKIINPPVRSYEIHRNPKTGYGFVAANEKPVIIQFVTPCSSSDGRLLPRDQILAVNGVDVRCESKLKVIEMIRRSSSTLRLEVSQPSRLKENGIKNHGVRKVRFTERIAVAGSPVEYGSLLSVAKVLRVYLENGQTRSFSYDSNTTVQNILDNLTEKLHVRLCAHFALAVEQSISLAPARLSLLLNTRRIESLAISPLSSRLRCRLRIAFPPVDLVAYSVNDPSGFDYFYQQCVNDFVDGRLVEMRYEASLRLAALHIRQVCMENSVLKRLPPIRRIEKEYGLATFLPTSWLEKVKPKDINGHLEFFLRKDQETFSELESYICQPRQRRSATDGHLKSVVCTDSTDPSTKLTDIVSLSDIPRILRIKYVTIVSLLPGFGLKCFSVNYKPTNVDIILQVDTRCGISVRYPGNRDCPPAMTITFSMLANIYTYPNSDDESTSCLCFQLQKTTTNGTPRNLEFIIDRYETDDLVAFVMGSANLYASRRLNYFESCPAKEDTAPPFHGYHLVQAAGWNYVDVDEHSKHVVDLRSGPPSFGHAITTTYTTHQENKAPIIRSTISQDDSSLPFDDIQRLNKEASEITVEPVEKPRHSVGSSRRRSSQQKFVQMLGTASAIINRNRSNTKRIRDSLRIHRQRHSLPNAVMDNLNATNERRWSSATRRGTVASTGSGLGQHSCVSRTALLRVSMSNMECNSQQQNTSVSSCKPLKSAALSARSEPETLPVDRKRTPHEARLLDLRRTWSLDERKHVRFDFSSTSVILPSPSPTTVTPPEIEEKCSNTVDQIARSFGTLCGQRFGQLKLSTSRTFPIAMNATKESDFTEDFVPLSYAAMEKKPVHPTKITVRRMSLKEFTGLENATNSTSVPRHSSAAYQKVESPLLGRLHGAYKHIVAESSRSTEYLNQCGRRRSSSALNRSGLNFGSREYVYEPFDKVIDEIAVVVEKMNNSMETEVDEKSGFDNTNSNLTPIEQLEIIESARKRLDGILKTIPTQSPKRRQPVEIQKNHILVNIGHLSTASKTLIRSIHIQTSAIDRSNYTHAVVVQANKIVTMCEKLLEKRNTYYQALILSKQLDQLLKTLADTVKDVNNAYDKPRFGSEFKRVSRSSNALAASITQTLKAVQSF